MNKYIEIEVKDNPKVFKIKFEKLEIRQHGNIFEITLAVRNHRVVYTTG